MSIELPHLLQDQGIGAAGGFESLLVVQGLPLLPGRSEEVHACARVQLPVQSLIDTGNLLQGLRNAGLLLYQFLLRDFPHCQTIHGQLALGNVFQYLSEGAQVGGAI